MAMNRIHQRFCRSATWPKSAQLQDQLFAEVNRVLSPGGVFAGSDSRVSAMFRLIHLYD